MIKGSRRKFSKMNRYSPLSSSVSPQDRDEIIEMTLRDENLTWQIIGAAIEVHKHLGPGLLESVYQISLARELALRRIPFRREVNIPVMYKGEPLDANFRADFIIDDRVILELKAIKKLLPVHEAQLITYMKIASCSVGLLINFNVPVLKDGIIRRVL